jgi:ATP-binding cassette, subfamily B, bacterial HlyB/CyaB
MESVTVQPESLLGFIRQIPLFKMHSDQELAELLKAVELRRLHSGQLVFDEGDSGDFFYIVYSGRIRILIRKEDRKEVSLGVITTGGHFGETALITNAPRNAFARAVEESVLLAISKATFHESLLATPEQRDYFERFIQSSSIHRFVRTCTDLSAVPAQELRELVLNFQPESFRAGQVVFRQGDPADKFYLIERGKAKVVRTEGGKQSLINFLHDGDFFGEKALIENRGRHADIICMTDCQLFSLNREAFEAMLQKSSRLRQVLEDRLRSYGSTTPPIAYHESIKQEMAADRKMQVGEELTPEEMRSTQQKRSAPPASFYRRHLRFPFIEQYDEMSCGTTCLMMIARYYGKNFSSARLRELASVDQTGASLANLSYAAEQVGFAARALKLTYQTLQSVHQPSIIHWRGYHFIVVYRVNAKYVWVADPGLGLRRYTRTEFCENWDGITLVLEPGPELALQKDDRTSIRNFLQYISPHKNVLLEVFLATILLNLLGLASPIFTQNVVDNVLGRHNPSLLNLMLLGMLLVLVFRVLINAVRAYLIAHTSMRIDLRMLIVFYKHMLALPLGYFKVRRTGDFISRFADNAKVREFFANTALSIVLDCIMIVVYVVLMFYYNTQMTLIALLLIPVVMMITAIFTPLLRRLTIDYLTTASESESHLIESIAGIDTVKAMGLEQRSRVRWEDKFTKALNIELRLSKTSIAYEAFGDFAATFSTTILLWMGANKVMQGAMSVGELMAYMVLVGGIVTPIDRVIRGWDKIQQTLVSINRLNEVLAAKPELPQSLSDRTGMVLAEPRGEITFDRVFFRYGGQDNPYIVSNISIKIPPGQTVAVVGRSGSGKSTFTKLVPRFWDVTHGRILLDGYDIRHLNLANLRRHVGFVLQETFLFDGTIRENIALDDPEESIARVIEAAKLAHAHDFISNLPMGYDTRVGESGLSLSGGQKQRIAIARALYRNPQVMIFDEATNALDAESEQAIQKNMETILHGKTAIIIAHRLSTIRNADRILVFDNGEIVEQGTHEELMARQGLYHYLNHQQFNI